MHSYVINDTHVVRLTLVENFDLCNVNLVCTNVDHKLEMQMISQLQSTSRSLHLCCESLLSTTYLRIMSTEMIVVPVAYHAYLS